MNLSTQCPEAPVVDPPIAETQQRPDAGQPRSDGLPRVSIILCTWRRLQEPIDTLRQLSASRAEGDELLVIDQNTEESIRHALQAACRELGASYVGGEPPGLARARNRGASLATREILLFVDDDVVANSDLVDQHRRWFSDQKVGGVAGRVVPRGDGRRPTRRWARATVPRISYWLGTSMGHFNHPCPLPIEHMPGGNMSCRRALWDAVGGADERFGPGHGVLEDVDLSLRISKAGYRLVYDPTAQILHLAAASGGDQVGTVSEYVFWYTRNTTLLYWEHLRSPLSFPIFLGMRLLRSLGFAISSRDPHCIPQAVRGIVTGWQTARAGRRPLADQRLAAVSEPDFDPGGRGRLDLTLHTEGAGKVVLVRESPVCAPGAAPKVSVVIPTLDGRRGGNLDHLLRDLEYQTVQDFEVILAINFKPNGHARNQGVRAARGDYLVCIDDDVRLGHNRVLAQLLQPFEELSCIGMTGPAQLIPDDSTRFQRRTAGQVSRATCPVVSRVTDTDFVTHMCLCMPTQLYKEIGWESDTLPRGTDPDLRRRVRQAGFRVVLTPGCWAYHPVPETLRSLLKVAWRNGAGSAWVYKNHPDFCVDTPDGHRADFIPVRTAPYRMTRFAGRFCLRLICLQYIGIANDLAYSLGYAFALTTGNDGLRKPHELAHGGDILASDAFSDQPCQPGEAPTV
jgi:GT2 family glycosyltransferase